jgi:phenylacetate-CoA ligase
MNIINIFIKYVLIPIQNKDIHFLKIYNLLQKSQWFSPNEIIDIQWKKFQKLINYSYLNVPYYHILFDNNKLNILDIKSINDILKIPCLSKKNINENFNLMLSTIIDKSRLIKQTTSGSTGEPITIFHDVNTQNIHTATGWRFREWAGHNIGDKYAQIWGRTVPTENKCNIFSNIKSLIRKIIENIIDPVEKLDTNDLVSNLVIEKFFLKIKRKRIQFLVGYASSIYFFAQYVDKYHSGEIKFKSVRTISEMLYDYQRNLIEKVFSCKVFNIYGNRENGLIASECLYHNGFHINAENLYVEVIDKDGHPLPPGYSGEIAITDLNNLAMPLIRYLTGDTGVISTKQCKCGRGLTLIDKIEGRIFDSLIQADGTILDGHILSAFFLNPVKEIEKYQFVQNKAGEADLFLKLSKPFNNDQFYLFQQNLLKYFYNKLDIKCHIVNDIPLHKSGKYKYIISNILK